jgi:hypothetical protein
VRYGPSAISEQGIEAALGVRHRGGDPRLVRLPPLRRRTHPLDEQIPDQRAIRMVVEERDHLVHPGAPPRIGWLERGSGERLVDVARDGAGLVELESVVLERWNPTERLTREVVVRRTARRKHVDLDQAVADALLGEGQAHDPHIDAVRRAKHDRYRQLRISCDTDDQLSTGTSTA